MQVVTMSVEELMGLINKEREAAYSNGYLKARKELETVTNEPKFNELLKGAKELKSYLEYKGYWKGSINTLNKVASQLLEEGDKQGHILLFRCGCIDHAFQNGFRFSQVKNKKINKIEVWQS